MRTETTTPEAQPNLISTKNPILGADRLAFSEVCGPKLTHYAFRYPAKFHVPVVRTLIDRYTEEGYTCLDPFNGSGTLMVEAATRGRNSIGLDVDPLAVFVSRVKTFRIHPRHLETSCKNILDVIRKRLSADPIMTTHLYRDISMSAYQMRIHEEGLNLPLIPNIYHWFRKSVIIQLARIKATIVEFTNDDDIRDFLLLCFASIIRRCSNADPTPVSGLEVTSYMRKKEEKGRSIDVMKEFEKNLTRSIVGAKEFYESTTQPVQTRVDIHDARLLADSSYNADAVITSPPYHSAVDYYRRHQLELYWLGLVHNQQERLQLIPNYLGRARVAKKLMPIMDKSMGKVGSYWTERIRSKNPQRANDFIHYYWGMKAFFDGVTELLPSNAPIVLVVGNNKVLGEHFPTVELFDEISNDKISFCESFWYPVKNRYMSYKRHNGANINMDYVLIWRRN